MSERTIEVKQYGNGHVVRYYSLDGAVRVTEARNGHSLDMELQAYLLLGPYELSKYFILGPDHPAVHHSTRPSEPTNLGSP